jgi:glutamate dehydrogenase
VHRRAHLDYIGIKLFDGYGQLQGELRIVGLFTASAYTNTTGEVPYLRHKVAKIVARAGFDPASYAGRALLNVLESYPRDELFQIDEETLYEFAIDIMNLSERPRVRALARADEFDRFVSVLVFVPKDRYDTSVRIRIGQFLAGIYEGAVSAAYPAYPEGPARPHPFHHRPRRRGDPADRPGDPRRGHSGHRAHLERRAGERSRSTIGGERARALARATPTPFRPPTARRSGRAGDRGHRRRSSALVRPAPRGRALPPRGRPGDAHQPEGLFARLALPLSERVPLLENLGFRVVNERTYRVLPPGGRERSASGCTTWRWSGRSAAISTPTPSRADRGALLALFRGLAESDGFNRLVLEAGLGWRDVAMVRALGRYLRQIRVAFGQDYLA